MTSTAGGSAPKEPLGGGPPALAPEAHAQKKTLKDDGCDSGQVKTLRADFPAQLADAQAEDLFFVDESGVNLTVTRIYACSLRSLRAFGSASRKWDDNVSISSAWSLGGLLVSMYRFGVTNGPVFLIYLKAVLLPRPWRKAGGMDNLGAHEVKEVGRSTEAAGAHLLYPAALLGRLQSHRNGLGQTQNFLRRVATRTSEALDCTIGEGRTGSARSTYTASSNNADAQLTQMSSVLVDWYYGRMQSGDGQNHCCGIGLLMKMT